MIGARGIDTDEIQDLMAALLELRGQLRNLQWYGEVNRRGFIKITKKLDKRVPGASAQSRYLASKVDPAAFASDGRLEKSLKSINDWLSALGDHVHEESHSPRSSLSLKRVASRPMLNFPTSLLHAIDQAIREDNAVALIDLLEQVKDVTAEMEGEDIHDKILKNLLQRSIFCRARSCIKALLERIEDLDEEDDINRRNCIHRLVISIGRSQSTGDNEQSANMLLEFPTEMSFITPATAPTMDVDRHVLPEPNQAQLLSRDDASVSLLEYLLDSLLPHQRAALKAQDGSGRTPLHFGAKYGFRVVCEIIIEHLQAWNIFDVTEGIDGPNWQDNDGWAPLHLSVVGGHPLTTRCLLDAENWSETSQSQAAVRKQHSKSSAVLALAVKANFTEIVRLLVNARVDINYQDEQGETALHVAARFGHDECAKILIHGSADQKADLELGELTYSWTPLFVASVDGNLGVVELLTAAGADIMRCDSSGWTAKEHATLRGHIEVARLLNELQPPALEDEIAESINVPTADTAAKLASLNERKSNGSSLNGSSRAQEPIKSFGHRYLTDESMVLVTLGTMDMRKNLPAVHLDQIPLSSAHATQLDTALSLVVSAQGATGESEIFDLPVQESLSTDPVVFHTADASKVKLLFDLVPTYAGSKDQIVGRGVALLSSIKSTLGSKRMSLQGDSTVPIVAASTLEVIGSVTFNFLIITPFSHPNMSVTQNQTYWKSMTPSTMVIGHRGLGKNIAGRQSLQLGENTIQSFIAAANLGASYVEFDVQLTKDHVPVIYHDFLVSETGIDAPVHTLTLEQFMHVNDYRTPRGSRPASPVTTVLNDRSKTANGINGDTSSTNGFPIRKGRSLSVGGSEYDSGQLDERMKHTRDFKKNGFKGNTRGNHIQAPFATLEEMFRKLPPSVGFNIEMKYPMLHESEEEEMDTYAVELNNFVDAVLKMVYDFGTTPTYTRNIMFSSFNPDICLLLSFKQPNIPVLFLTDSGVCPVGDVRASSLQEAIRFASRWNLLGVVSAAEPLVISPRLVKVVKESGLVCVTYGAINNDPSVVQVSFFFFLLILSLFPSMDSC